MSSGGSSVQVDRVVAVAAALRDGREQLGSGYLISGRRVLTAEHCTRDKATGEPAARLRVVRASDGVVAEVVGVVSDRGLDVAVLQLADDSAWDADLPPMPFARVDQNQSGVLEDCTGIGFPLFQRDPARRTRQTSEFHGTIYQTDERESGRLLMREPLIHPGPVTGPEGEALSERGEEGPSQWGGLSGALILYRGSAIGVVVEHHPRQGDSALRAIGFERIAAARTEIRQCLGLPEPGSLPCVSEQAAVRLELAGVRVSEADPRRLGVHAAISVSGVPDDVPPEYVPRDVDDGELRLRAKLAAAAERGGFVLLVGGSSVGKSRCAFEAVAALLPDWWLVHPAGPGEVAELAAAPTTQTVVWLDELQRYMDGERGLTAGVVRALLNAPHPVVIIGTIWPDRYTAYAAVPVPGGADPHAREREVLDMADVVRVAPEFSYAEQDRARAAAARDPRLQVALEAYGYGLTQTLAAAPQLVARWEDAQTAHPYAWAVLSGALDAARLGARAPLNADLLRAAAPGYCTSQQQAEAPHNWFEQALAYATDKLHGAVAALSPAGSGMGRIVGYMVADYLLQHASRERHYVRVPASTWDAVLSHIRDPADADRLAESAKNRLLYRYAIPLYRRAADAGDKHAAQNLAELLAERGDLDELRGRADVGDGWAALQLARLQAECGNQDKLRSMADAGDKEAAMELHKLLVARGDTETPEGAAQATQLLRPWIDISEMFPALRLAKRGELDELRALAHASGAYAVEVLVNALAERGDLDELRSWAKADSYYANYRLARLLAERGDLDELRSWAEADRTFSSVAAVELASLLAERGNRGELRSLADDGDEDAARRLARMLAECGDMDELLARVHAGDKHAAYVLAGLIKQSQGEEAEQLRRFGLNPDGSIASA